MAGETDSSAVEALLGDLAQNVDDVESALRPLLSKALSTTSSKLPLLDKAKLYVHTAYAIESLIFSYLRLSGVDAKSHPVFSELSRVRAYFQKISAAESTGPSSKLDKGAANRFIKHALSGNDEYDRKREETRKSQEAGAKRKHDELAERYGKHSRFEGTSKRIREEDGVQASDISAASSAPEEDASPRGGEKPSTVKKAKKKSHAPGAKGWGASDKEQKPSSRHKKKHSHAPKDAHQAFQTLLDRGKS